MPLIDKINKNPIVYTQRHPYTLLLNGYIRKYYIKQYKKRRAFPLFEIYCIISTFDVSSNAITGCWGSSNLATINITKDLKFSLKMKFLVKKAFDQGENEVVLVARVSHRELVRVITDRLNFLEILLLLMIQ